MTLNFGDGDVGGVDMHACLIHKAARTNVRISRNSFTKIPLHQEDVSHVGTTHCRADCAIYIHQCIQGKTPMATGFFQAISKAAIQTRANIQEENKAEVGATEMGEGR